MQSKISAPLLSVEDLNVRFRAGDLTIHAVNGVSLSVEAGKTVCLVGESGSGKSVTAMAISGLLPRTATVSANRLELLGQSLLGLTEGQWRAKRGNDIAVIFQDPMSSLNPALSVGTQVAEGLVRHRGCTWSEARLRARQVLDQVRIPDAERRLDSYPHEMSGGMRQRVMIAMALVCEPKLLIADEPTTALDVTIQAQILSLIDELRRELGLGVLLITHDLGVVADCADNVVVMYGGTLCEEGGVEEIFDHPAHPYTVGLMRAKPGLDGDRAGRLHEIPGSVPRLTERAAGCVFRPRCALTLDACAVAPMVPRPVANHITTCIRAGEIDIERAIAEDAL